MTQAEYIAILWADLRKFLPTLDDLDTAAVAKLPTSEKSQLIGSLKASLKEQRAKAHATAPALPAPARPAAPAKRTDAQFMEIIREGTYELPATDANGDEIPGAHRFFRVKHGHSRLFLDETNGKRGGARELYYLKRAERDTVLEALAADVLGAAARFGKVGGWCGICGKDLKVPASIERGIGPVCWANLGGDPRLF